MYFVKSFKIGQGKKEDISFKGIQKMPNQHFPIRTFLRNNYFIKKNNFMIQRHEGSHNLKN